MEAADLPNISDTTESNATLQTLNKRILKTLLLAAFHRNQLVAVTSELLQNANIQSRDETAFYETDEKQITDSFGILRIILVSLYSLYPFGVGNHDPNTALFQDVEYGNPIFPGGFHADIQTVVFQKPIRKTVQVGIEGTESLFLVVGL